MNQRPRAVKVQKHESGDLRFGTRNYAALGAALVSILVGFLLLSRGSITAAPILLVLGYCVLVPYGLAAGRKRTSGGE
jgi:hypothetical protein